MNLITPCKIDAKLTRLLFSIASGALSTLLFVFGPNPAYANPVLDQVVSGSATVTQSPNQTVINQTTDKAIIHWQSFNIGAGESTHFAQPAGGAALNRINPAQGASAIYGSLTATGQIILINSAGIFFGPSAYVNVGGLIASTANLSDQSFLSGQYQFLGHAAAMGSVVNQGTIIAANHGLVALLGNSVSNEGYIEANLGHVVLASGESFTMSFAGNELISFAVDGQATGSVKNTGHVRADGGKVIVSASAAAGVLDHVINMEGIVEARSVSIKNGEIILNGGKNGVVRVAGTLDASGLGNGETGGKVIITGFNIHLDQAATIRVSGRVGGGSVNVGGSERGEGPIANANAVYIAPGVSVVADATEQGDGGRVIVWSDISTQVHGFISARGGESGGEGGFVETSSKGYLNIAGARVDTRATQGQAGVWLLDPLDVYITTSATSGGSFAGGDPDIFTPTANDSNILNTDLEANLATANVTITTGSTGSQSGDIYVNADIDWSSDNQLILSAYRHINVNANITNLISSSAKLTLQADNTGTGVGTITGLQSGGSGSVNLSGAQSAVLIYYNPTTFPTADGAITSGTGSGIFANVSVGSTNLSRTYMLVNSLNDLQAISANLTADYALGKDIDATATSGWNGGLGFDPLGDDTNKFIGNFDGQNHTISNITINRPSEEYVGLFGYIDSSSVTNLNVSGTVSGERFVGGVIGGVDGNSLIDNVHSNVEILVTVVGSFGGFGGLIAFVSGAVVVSNASAIVNIDVTNAPSFLYLGGLVGRNSGIIRDSYSAGTITVNTSSTVFGGFVGDNQNGSAIYDSYSTVNIFASSNSSSVGGFVGRNTGLISGSYSTGNIQVNSGSAIGGFVGQSLTGTGIANSYTSSNVLVVNNGLLVGGFGGLVTRPISNSYSTGNVEVGANSQNIGGFVGLYSSNINNSYSTGAVKVGDNSSEVGGFAGRSSSGVSSVTDAYTFSHVQVGNNVNNVGGFIGENAGSSQIIRAFSTGYVDVGTGSTNVGGFVGNNSAQITNSFWNTDTSGQANGFGVNTGTISNLTGGCVGVCTNGGTANLFAQSTFSSAPYSWDFATTWKIIEGQSYPYLQVFYGTPRALSAVSDIPANAVINLAVNGVTHDTARTGANGFVYFLEGLNLISNVDTSIADNEPVFVYATSGGVANAVVVAPTGNASLSGSSQFELNTNNLSLGTSLASTISNSDISTAVGSLTGSNVLFALSGANIILNTGVGLVTNTVTTYLLNANINAINASIIFNGPVATAANAIITLAGTVASTIKFANGISGGNDLVLNGGNSANDTVAIIGTLTLNDLTINGFGGTDQITLNTSSPQMWNITGNNSGTVTGITGVTGAITFSSIEGVIGGNGVDQFIFSNNAVLSGNVAGGDVASNNQVDFSAYQSPITVVLSALTSGSASYQSGTITGFSSIGDIVGNYANAASNLLTAPSKYIFTYTGPGIGYIDDPTYFYGFNLAASNAALYGSSSAVSPIILQSMQINVEVEEEEEPLDIEVQWEKIFAAPEQCMSYNKWNEFSTCFQMGGGQALR